MADISMCMGIGCPKKGTCYRYTAPKSDWQSYSHFCLDHRVGRGKCPHYWPNEAELKRIDENAPPKTQENDD